MPEEEDMVSFKKKKKKSRNQYLGYLFLGVCASSMAQKWSDSYEHMHRRAGVCYVNNVMCKICSWTIFLLPFPRRQVGIPTTRAVRWGTGMIRRAPHLQEKMTILNFKNVLGLTEKAQNK